jgi:hypothetical protein
MDPQNEWSSENGRRRILGPNRQINIMKKRTYLALQPKSSVLAVSLPVGVRTDLPRMNISNRARGT